jgi:hypothetical protein
MSPRSKAVFLATSKESPVKIFISKFKLLASWIAEKAVSFNGSKNDV